MAESPIRMSDFTCNEVTHPITFMLAVRNDCRKVNVLDEMIGDNTFYWPEFELLSLNFTDDNLAGNKYLTIISQQSAGMLQCQFGTQEQQS